MKKQENKFYPKNGRVILHVDMNAFYCSVHAAVEPDRYKGKCIAVAGSVELRKGIIVTSSYEARHQGVRTGMQVREAMKRCPDLIVIPPDFHLYRKFSKQFMEIALNYSPLVEAMSIDECFIDITGSKQFGTPLEIASTMQKRIKVELGLPCSIGIAPNKLLAKMASDMKKPNGITVLRLRDVRQVLWDKPCSYLFGIGQRTAEKLKNIKINTIGELAQTEETLLIQHFGVLGIVLKMSANGIDSSPVEPVQEKSKSIGHTTTLPYNFSNQDDIHRVFLNIADQVTRRLRRQHMLSSTVQITIRNPDMKTITRAFTLSVPTDHMDEIYEVACRLFSVHWQKNQPVRLLGITLSQLQEKTEAAVQLDLFSYEDQPKKEQLNEIMDKLRDKYGENSIVTAGMLGDDPSALLRNTKIRGTSLQKDHLREMFKKTDKE